MKPYKIAYEYYPFNMEDFIPKMEVVEAASLNEAFDKMEKKYSDKIEIFKEAARKFYNEP
jgi:hypothetical protein